MNEKAEARIFADLERIAKATRDAAEAFTSTMRAFGPPKATVEEVIGCLDGVEETVRRVVAGLGYFRR